MIILLQKRIVHRLFIDSFIPLSKQPTADVRSVLIPSREHTHTDAFSTHWQQRRQNCCRPLHTCLLQLVSEINLRNIG